MPRLARLAFKNHCEKKDDNNTSLNPWYESTYNNKIKQYVKSDSFKTGAFNYCLKDFETKKSSLIVRGVDQAKQYTYVADKEICYILM